MHGESIFQQLLIPFLSEILYLPPLHPSTTARVIRLGKFVLNEVQPPGLRLSMDRPFRCLINTRLEVPFLRT